MGGGGRGCGQAAGCYGRWRPALDGRGVGAGVASAVASASASAVASAAAALPLEGATAVASLRVALGGGLRGCVAVAMQVANNVGLQGVIFDETRHEILLEAEAVSAGDLLEGVADDCRRYVLEVLEVLDEGEGLAVQLFEVFLDDRLLGDGGEALVHEQDKPGKGRVEVGLSESGPGGLLDESGEVLLVKSTVGVGAEVLASLVDPGLAGQLQREGDGAEVIGVLTVPAALDGSKDVRFDQLLGGADVGGVAETLVGVGAVLVDLADRCDGSKPAGNDFLLGGAGRVEQRVDVRGRHGGELLRGGQAGLGVAGRAPLGSFGLLGAFEVERAYLFLHLPLHLLVDSFGVGLKHGFLDLLLLELRGWLGG